MSRFRVALIGCGARASSYAGPYLGSGEVTLAALADPSPESRTRLKRGVGVPADTPEYDDWRVMLREHREIDGVAISSPTVYHVDQAVACYERGLPVALEKPIAVTPAECDRLLDAERANGGRSLVGFVLRSTPFYSRIRAEVASGRLGRIVGVQADELVGRNITSVMFRNPWRRRAALSGGALLEKCCHDMDLLSWLIGSRPLSVHSYGGLRVMGPNPQLPDYCEGCAVAGSCVYYRERPVALDAPHPGASREDYACIYNIDKDVADVQSVALEYENGAIAHFLMTFNAAGERAGRNLHLIGTRGRLWGNFESNTFSIFDNATGSRETVTLQSDGSGHGGGDRLHALLLLRMMAEPDYVPEQNAAAGYLSAMICFAADRSMAEGRRVAMRMTGANRVELS